MKLNRMASKQKATSPQKSTALRLQERENVRFNSQKKQKNNSWSMPEQGFGKPNTPNLPMSAFMQ